MVLRFLNTIRRFSSTSRRLHPYLSENYKSRELWNERFNCRILSSNEETIKKINSKIMQDESLNNLELDIFINNSTPNVEDIIQLRESARLLKEFRKTLHAHTLLPSTSHALCRLFLYSERIDSLVRVLDQRIQYGIFPDFFSYNLIIENAIDKQNYSLASKIASLIMLQEEFGVNAIADRLCLFALVKYIESGTDFTDWIDCDLSKDHVFNDAEGEQKPVTSDEVSKKKEETTDEEEDEEDAEYIRVPFLRNPFFDNHFDLRDPRMLCGKSLSTLSQYIQCDGHLKDQANLLGLVLQNKWEEAALQLESLNNSTPLSIKPALLNFTKSGSEDVSREKFFNLISSLSDQNSLNLSQLVKVDLLDGKLDEFELLDIEELKSDIIKWSELRLSTEKRNADKLRNQQIKEAVQAKKEELMFREQYLYFYDNLKKSKLNRISYD